MMIKKNFYFLTFFGIFTSAQVGINTANPQGVFHIDGAKDNPLTGAPSAVQQLNDVVVTSTGNVGIGTTTPTRKLEIVSSTSPALRVNDGNQNVNYVLMSDASGYGTWRALSKSISAIFPETGYSGKITGSSGKVTPLNVTLTLPPGKWLVLTNIVLNSTTNPTSGNGAWVRLQWSLTNTQGSFTSADLKQFSGPYNSGIFVAPYGNAVGTTIIDNTAATTDTNFYLMLGGVDMIGNYVGDWNELAGKKWAENSIIAYPAN